ncbi:SLC13 family permease [Cyclobacterium marinum]|uniref:TrkA-C domain protein n=1 Tax=Cyclobacterium marinum (strain ATCC 25205 / DSM 745 / LMG 13164 / NCIMB 1802) TaxID=880070 RepID=G0J8H9_CYCMS|nr:SLC13 family permease [Cyclobacterium marinum]AEL28779.1 TrkA-C domain protein [Cyclobacterium marinum DSM 745]|tara:strand:+ start:72027 stop:73784 length:1758 start_codon:yes stop_codon:yes gene_type:complete
MSFPGLITISIVIVLVFVLYRDLLRPSFAFLGAVFLLLVLQIITPEDFLMGLANKQIIVIFLLIGLTSGIQQNIGTGFFFKIFSQKLKPGTFRLRLMLLVSSLSAILNNTPVVAFMIPYVKKWTKTNNFPASKFLIPLSYSTILGGMITVVGTSTNLVLNGLISQFGYPLLGFEDFLYLGVLVASIGMVYLSIASNYLLPSREENKSEVIEHLNEYLVETYIPIGSSMHDKTVKEAGLRKLKEIFLAEIRRGKKEISPVGPNEVLQEGDKLFFAGNSEAILKLIQGEQGLSLPEDGHVSNYGFFQLTEAVVPASSSLIGLKVKDSDFRNKYQGSIISIHRNGTQLKGNIGETRVHAGDLFLMLTGKDHNRNDYYKDLIIVTLRGEISADRGNLKRLPSLLALSVLFIGIIGWIDLFIAAFAGILILYLFKVLNLQTLKKAVDLDLLLILVCSLSLGLALNSSGAAGVLVNFLIQLTEGAVPMVGLVILFIITLVLTSLITNAAAVSIMFPIALELGNQLEQPLTPFFVAIAFAASGDFMTPIGYQTNLMVMGPGNYKFKDYFVIGFPLTLIYAVVVLLFINWYYL